jgi:hypothetical protein
MKMGAWISGWRYVYVYIRARANQVMKKWKPSGAVMEIGDASLLPFGMTLVVPLFSSTEGGKFRMASHACLSGLWWLRYACTAGKVIILRKIFDLIWPSSFEM